MTAVLLALALTPALLCVLAWRRRDEAAPRRARVSVDRQLPRPAGPEVAALDDAGFRVWVGGSPATYDRYVDTGIEDVEIFLADRPARQVGEDPAAPAA